MMSRHVRCFSVRSASPVTIVYYGHGDSLSTGWSSVIWLQQILLVVVLCKQPDMGSLGAWAPSGWLYRRSPERVVFRRSPGQ